MNSFKRVSMVLTVIMMLTLRVGVTRAANTDPNPNGPDGNWEYLPNVSDEFNVNGLDTTKWESNCTSWSNSWSWDQANVSVANGELSLTMDYEPHDTINNSVYGWNTSTTRWGIPWSYSVNDSPRTGNMHLRYHSQDCYELQDVTTYQVLSIPNGTYTFRAYAKSSGGQDEAIFRLKNHGGANINIDIIPSLDYTLYEQTVDVTTGTLHVEIYSQFQGGDKWLDIDDISLIRVGESINRVTNGSFDENIKTVNYKSAAIVSKDRVTEKAYYEARIKGASRQQGVCPAFWATHYSGDDHREIDFVELQQSGYKNMDYVLHLAYSKTLNPHVTSWKHPGYQVYHANFDPRDDYHVYGCEVTDTVINFYVDGEKVRSMIAAQWEFADKAYNVWLSMGVRPPLHSSPTANGFPTTMNVDYIRVWKQGEATPPPVAIGPIVDDYDASIVYDGPWNEHQNGLLWYEGTIHATNTFNASATMTFNGTSVKLIGRKSWWCGKMDVYIDDIFQQTIDTYSATLQDQVLIYENTDLSDDQHIIRIVSRGEKNSDSTDAYIHVDKFEVNQ